MNNSGLWKETITHATNNKHCHCLHAPIFHDALIQGKSKFDSKISRILEQILMEHIELICSLESGLTLISICSIRIHSRKGDIVEKPQLLTISIAVIPSDQISDRESYVFFGS